jgi:acetylornithine deacetylase/succinyl-diaminopimelate desuccinylase-like protein
MRANLARLAAASDGAQQRLFGLLSGRAGSAALRALAPAIRARSATLGHLLADTITPTQLTAGYATNVVPGAAEAVFDARLLPDTDPDEVLSWLRAVGRRDDVEVAELHRWASPVSAPGRLFDLLAELSEGLPGAPVSAPSLSPGMTDLRWLRARGATAYGWAPVVLTPELLATVHGHDERVPVDQLVAAQAAMDELVRRACT